MFEYILALIDWLKVAVLLRKKNKKLLFKEGEVWWCSIGMNVGVEIYGKGPKFTRPVLIYKKFSQNSFFGIPLTSQQKEGDWYVPISFNKKHGMIVLNQGRTLDMKRLVSKMGEIDYENFETVRCAFSNIYDTKMRGKYVAPPGEAGLIGDFPDDFSHDSAEANDVNSDKMPQ
jgi:mRNA interferase MazF